MMQETNFYVLSHCRLTSTEKEKRLRFLQDTVNQLHQYQNSPRLKPVKMSLVNRLIVSYETLLYQLGA